MTGFSRRHACTPLTPIALAALAALLVAPSSALARKHARPTSVVLTAPKPGDISYGQAQVRITKRARRPHVHGRSVVFASRAGGLSVVARSPAWRKLRGDTHVNVVVSPVKGAGKNVKNVTFFIYRRLGKGKHAPGGRIRFTIANATPQTSSFWVRGFDRHGNAEIFTDTNAIARALGNWSHYLHVLKLARAFAAALRPDDVHGEFAKGKRAVSPAAEKSAVRGLATTGTHMTRHARAVEQLIFGTIGDKDAFQEAKHSPLATRFISSDLHNPALAKRFAQVIALLPFAVPDRYAANAGEEARFSHITSPKVSHREVRIADKGNAETEAAIESPASASDTAPGARVVVHMTGAGSGSVTGDGIDCPGTTCTLFYSAGEEVSLYENPVSGSSYGGFQGCNAGTAGANQDGTPFADKCNIRIPSSGHSATMNVYANFLQGSAPNVHSLNVSLPGSGSGTVTSDVGGLHCPSNCSVQLKEGAHVVLTATPASGSAFAEWPSGCDAVSGNRCSVTMTHDRTVAADFARAGGPGPGSLDEAFGNAGVVLTPVGTNFAFGAQDIARQDDGKLVVAGQGTDDLGNLVTKVARYNTDGTLDTSFGDSSSGITTIPAFTEGTFVGGKVALDGSGGILVGGTLNTSGQPDFAVVRLSSDGSVDTTFGSNGLAHVTVGDGSVYTTVNAVVYDADIPEIVVAGTAASSSKGEFALAAFNADGSVRTEFGSSGLVLTAAGSGDSQINGLALDGGYIFAAGFAHEADATLEAAVVRYNALGQVTTPFGDSGVATLSLGSATQDSGAYSIASASGGQVVLGGFGIFSGSSGACLAVARLNFDGSTDTTFGSSGIAHQCLGDDGSINGVAIAPGGDVYGAGYMYDGSDTQTTVTRFTAAGSLDSAFGGGTVTTAPSGSGKSSQANAIVMDGANPVTAGSAQEPPTDVDYALERFEG